MAKADITAGRAQRLARAAGAFLFIWSALLALHGSLLRLPYYWDEAGYYVPAARDFLLGGTLVPFSTLTNAHPPLPSVLMAAAWRVFGYRPLVTRVLICAVAAEALLAAYWLARAFAGRWVSAATAALTAIYPIWFAQSTLAHADIFAAAFTLSALALFAHRGRPDAASITLLCAAALAKETAIVTAMAMFLVSAYRFVRYHRNSDFRDAAWWTVPALPLACWYAYHRLRTGFTFGNPEFLRYNATSNLRASRFLFALACRAWHVLGHMNLWVPLLITLLLWALTKSSTAAADKVDPPAHRREVIQSLAAVFALNLLFFSIAGGALLTRYLLPLYPLVLLLHVRYWSRKTRLWWAFAAITAVAFIAGWTINPPYGFAAEDNLSYRDAIVCAQSAIAQLPRPGDDTRVLTAWPLSDDLTKPELGYVTAPYQVVALKDLSAASLLDRPTSAAANYAVLFPSGPEPSYRLFRLNGAAQQTNLQYFGAHDNVGPATGARLLGMTVTWQMHAGGEWAAVLSAPQPVLDAKAPRLGATADLSAAGDRSYNP